MKTLNAVIKEATIKINDSNTGLEPIILLKFNSFEMYFGKDLYDYNENSNLNYFVNNILNITEKRRWDDVKNTNIRVKIEENNDIIALGHITNDNIWFFPNTNLNHNIENTKELNYSYIVNSEDSDYFFVGFNYDSYSIEIFDKHIISKETPRETPLKVKIIFYIDKVSQALDAKVNVYFVIPPSYTDNNTVFRSLSDLVDEIKNSLFKTLDIIECCIEEYNDELIIYKIIEVVDETDNDLNWIPKL